MIQNFQNITVQIYCIDQKISQMEEKIILVKLVSNFTVKTKKTIENGPDVVMSCVNGVHASLGKLIKTAIFTKTWLQFE